MQKPKRTPNPQGHQLALCPGSRTFRESLRITWRTIWKSSGVALERMQFWKFGASGGTVHCWVWLEPKSAVGGGGGASSSASPGQSKIRASICELDGSNPHSPQKFALFELCTRRDISGWQFPATPGKQAMHGLNKSLLCMPKLNSSRANTLGSFSRTLWVICEGAHARIPHRSPKVPDEGDKRCEQPDYCAFQILSGYFTVSLLNCTAFDRCVEMIAETFNFEAAFRRASCEECAE